MKSVSSLGNYLLFDPCWPEVSVAAEWSSAIGCRLRLCVAWDLSKVAALFEKVSAATKAAVDDDAAPAAAGCSSAEVETRIRRKKTVCERSMPRADCCEKRARKFKLSASSISSAALVSVLVVMWSFVSSLQAACCSIPMS